MLVKSLERTEITTERDDYGGAEWGYVDSIASSNFGSLDKEIAKRKGS